LDILPSVSCGTIVSMIEHIGGRKTRTNFSALIFVFVIIILGCGLIIVSRTNSHKTISPIPDSPQPQNPIVRFFTREKDPDDLRNKVKELADLQWKNYSVYVKDLGSDFEMGIGEKVIYTGASVNKVPILAALYYQHQKDGVDLDKVITLQTDDIQDYGTGTIRYDPAGTTYTVKTLARLMMTKSDNTAAFLIANYVLSVDAIQQLVNGWGMTQTDMANNKTSNYDMALLFEKIFHEKIANHAYTLDMLSMMTNTDFEDRIPAELPKQGVTIYHKTGNGAGIIHDVGIVQTGKTAYYIGVLTSDVPDEQATTKCIADISKAVFDFMK